MKFFLKKPRGVQDIYYPRSIFYKNFQDLVHRILSKNGYHFSISPSFEYENFFLKSLSLNSNSLSKKEIFSFNDKKGRILALRPEGTSSILRMVIENKLVPKNFYTPLKLYYLANMFRYERPQKNRYREFWQLGVELLNSRGVIADFQLLNIANEIFESIGIKNFIFEINYLGNSELKKKYSNEIRRIVSSLIIKENIPFCLSCKENFASGNVFLILDCKFCNSKIPLPPYNDFLPSDELIYLENIKNVLHEFKIPFVFNNRLFRGISYYTGIIFEININNEKTLLGGGRYDDLYKLISNGERDVPAAGFAIGVDRIINFLENYVSDSPIFNLKEGIDVFFFVSEYEYYYDVIKWKKNLENNNISSELNMSLVDEKKISNLINLYKPSLLIFLNSDYNNAHFRIKNILSGDSVFVKRDSIFEYVKNFFIKKLIN